MTEELNFEAYLFISRKKFEIQLLDKKNLNQVKIITIKLETNLYLHM